MFDMKQDAITPAELAESTGFSINTLATWRSKEKGPKFVRIMGRVYYLKSDVNQWLTDEINAA